MICACGKNAFAGWKWVRLPGKTTSPGRGLSQIGVNRLWRTTPFTVFINFPPSNAFIHFYLFCFIRSSRTFPLAQKKKKNIFNLPPFPLQVPQAHTVPINARSNLPFRVELFSLHHLLLCLYGKVTQGSSVQHEFRFTRIIWRYTNYDNKHPNQQYKPAVLDQTNMFNSSLNSKPERRFEEAKMEK